MRPARFHIARQKESYFIKCFFLIMLRVCIKMILYGTAMWEKPFCPISLHVLHETGPLRRHRRHRRPLVTLSTVHLPLLPLVPPDKKRRKKTNPAIILRSKIDGRRRGRMSGRFRIQVRCSLRFRIFDLVDNRGFDYWNEKKNR